MGTPENSLYDNPLRTIRRNTSRCKTNRRMYNQLHKQFVATQVATGQFVAII